MRRALIDTNIYSLAMRGEPSVLDRLQQLDEIGFTVVSLGELLVGFRGGSRETENRCG
jgi:tRNA(fMet)-specific endonuclease VapC